MVQSKPKNWRFSKNSISKLLSSFLYWCLERSGLGRGGVLTVFCLAVNYGVKLIVFQLCEMRSIVISYWEAFTDISEDNWPEEWVKEAAATTNNPVWCKIFIFRLIQKIVFTGWSSCHLDWCIWWYIFSWWHEQQPYNIKHWRGATCKDIEQGIYNRIVRAYPFFQLAILSGKFMVYCTELSLTFTILFLIKIIAN